MKDLVNLSTQEIIITLFHIVTEHIVEKSDPSANSKRSKLPKKVEAIVLAIFLVGK